MRTLTKLTCLAFGLFALGTAVLLGPAQSGSAQSPTPTLCPHCNEDFATNKPINDLGQGTYYPTGSPTPSPGTTPVQGGLYPRGFNQRPIAHNNKGINIAQTKIVPRKRDGTADPDGTDPNSRIVMISIGMCNTSKEFGGNLGVDVTQGFVWRVMDPDNQGIAKWRNPKLVAVDCAQSGMGADKWADEQNLDPWAVLDTRLRNNVQGGALSRKQVQVIWLKEALAQPDNYGVWPDHAKQLKTYLETILGRLVSPTFAYPFGKVGMVFLSPRTRAWTLDEAHFHHSPEPFAYETGFADKWLIEEQINPGGQGWPWLSWGPYIWADGLNERSDHFTWLCSDVVADCVHPTDDGVRKVSDQLLAFFKTDPVATPWFLKKPAAGEVAPTFSPSPTPTTVVAGDSGGLDFHVSATPHAPATTIVEYVWTFDDGDYAYDPMNHPLLTDVNKRFPAPSESGNPYQVHVTAIDDLGNAGFATIPVTVTPATPGPQHRAVNGSKHQTETLARPEQGAVRNVTSAMGKKGKR